MMWNFSGPIKMVERVLGFFNVRIYRLKPHQVGNPIELNSIETINKYYSDPQLLKEYLSDDRLKFYDGLIAHLTAKGVSFNEGLRLVDVGCGPGILLEKIGRRFPG